MQGSTDNDIANLGVGSLNKSSKKIIWHAAERKRCLMEEWERPIGCEMVMPVY